jgi:hypothetical protein
MKRLFELFATNQSASNDAIETALLTLGGGLILFVLSNVFLKFVLDPIQILKRRIGEIAEEIMYYSNLYTNPLNYRSDSGRYPTKEQVKRYRDGSDRLRRLSSSLRGDINVIPFYGIVRIVFRLPSLQNILLHNAMFYTGNGDWYEAIERAETDIKNGLGIR